MDHKEQLRLLVLANMVELSKRALINLVGNDISTRIDGEDVSENAEVLLTNMLREKLMLKVA